MSYAHVTFAMALPRSRTAWTAAVFGELVLTQHEPLRDCESIAELQRKVDALTRARPGTPLFLIDTAAVFFHQEIHERFAGSRRLFIKRKIGDVRRSMSRKGLPTDKLDAAAEYFGGALIHARARRIPSAYIAFEDLDDPVALGDMARFVGHTDAIAPEFWLERIQRNIQVDVAELEHSVDPRKAQALFKTVRDL